ncbi:MAG: transcription termination factor Rho [Chthoniobacterales bacterium]|nr:transcription termination factor Rho [Chthoniobacterales bacterium]
MSNEIGAENCGIGIADGAVSIQRDLHVLGHRELLERAERIGARIRPDSTKLQLCLDQARCHLERGEKVVAEGVLEVTQNQAMLRWGELNFKPSVDDAMVPNEILKKYRLQSGLKLGVSLRLPRDHRERGLVVDTVEKIEGIDAREWEPPTPFEKLTPIFPKRRILLETADRDDITPRAIDLIAPLGMGQRGIIAAPPRAGKTMILKSVARTITRNHPEAHLILLLVDERPEEVTDMRGEIRADIFSSTFDEPVTRHVQICELVNERAQRLVEHKKDVIILIDSLTRMARGYNKIQPDKGRTMTGGVDSRALIKPRKFFGSARNVEEGGSLTILATALIETQSKMDDLIFEEFKGTGNMELHLDRTIAEQRIFPAIHIMKSGTRREDLLYHPDELQRVSVLRKQLSSLPPAEAMDLLIQNLRNTGSNAELLLTGLRGI